MSASLGTLQNWGRSQYQDNFHVTLRLPEGEFRLEVTDEGRSRYEADFRIQGQLPCGAVDLFMDHHPRGTDFTVRGTVDRAPCELEIRPHRIQGELPQGRVDLDFSPTSNSTRYRHHFDVQGTVAGESVSLHIEQGSGFQIRGRYDGEPVDLVLDDIGRGRFDTSFDMTGLAPVRMIASPLFLPIVLAVVQAAKRPLYEDDEFID